MYSIFETEHKGNINHLIVSIDDNDRAITRILREKHNATEYEILDYHNTAPKLGESHTLTICGNVTIIRTYVSPSSPEGVSEILRCIQVHVVGEYKHRDPYTHLGRTGGLLGAAMALVTRIFRSVLDQHNTKLNSPKVRDGESETVVKSIRFQNPIVHGGLNTTVRLGNKKEKYKLGDIIKVIDDNGDGICIGNLLIEEVRVCKIGDLCDDDLRLQHDPSTNTVDGLVGALVSFYKETTITTSTEVTIISFRVIRNFGIRTVNEQRVDRGLRFYTPTYIDGANTAVSLGSNNGYLAPADIVTATNILKEPVATILITGVKDMRFEELTDGMLKDYHNPALSSTSSLCDYMTKMETPLSKSSDIVSLISFEMVENGSMELVSKVPASKVPSMRQETEEDSLDVMKNDILNYVLDELQLRRDKESDTTQPEPSSLITHRETMYRCYTGGIACMITFESPVTTGQEAFYKIVSIDQISSSIHIDTVTLKDAESGHGAVSNMIGIALESIRGTDNPSNHKTKEWFMRAKDFAYRELNAVFEDQEKSNA